jgi:hypothetical protein
MVLAGNVEVCVIELLVIIAVVEIYTVVVVVVVVFIKEQELGISFTLFKNLKSLEDKVS